MFVTFICKVRIQLPQFESYFFWSTGTSRERSLAIDKTTSSHEYTQGACGWISGKESVQAWYEEGMERKRLLGTKSKRKMRDGTNFLPARDSSPWHTSLMIDDLPNMYGWRKVSDTRCDRESCITVMTHLLQETCSVIIIAHLLLDPLGQRCGTGALHQRCSNMKSAASNGVAMGHLLSIEALYHTLRTYSVCKGQRWSRWVEGFFPQKLKGSDAMRKELFEGADNVSLYLP